MTELTPDVHAIRYAVVNAARIDAGRRTQRRRVRRACAVGIACLLALSGSALAAGEMLGVVDLSGGLRAQPVDSLPAFDATTHTFVRIHSKNYLYHVTGGQAPSGLECKTRGVGGNDIYVESSRPLTTSDLELASEIAREGGNAASVKHAGGLKAAFEAIPGLLSAGDGCGNPRNIERVVGGPVSSGASRRR